MLSCRGLFQKMMHWLYYLFAYLAIFFSSLRVVLRLSLKYWNIQKNHEVIHLYFFLFAKSSVTLIPEVLEYSDKSWGN